MNVLRTFLNQVNTKKAKIKKYVYRSSDVMCELCVCFPCAFSPTRELDFGNSNWKRYRNVVACGVESRTNRPHSAYRKPSMKRKADSTHIVKRIQSKNNRDTRTDRTTIPIPHNPLMISKTNAKFSTLLWEISRNTREHALHILWQVYNKIYSQLTLATVILKICDIYWVFRL